MSSPPCKKHITAAVVSASKKESQQAETKKPVEDFFAKLPDEIVLKVLHTVDNKMSILALRQTCRQLRRLCEDPTLEDRLPILLRAESVLPFSHRHGSGSLVEAEVCRSSRTGALLKVWKDHAFSYRQMMWRNKMCDDCSELRRDPDVYQRAVDRMYTQKMCSGCKTRHPAFLFSHLERQKKADQRVCIGHQGHISLCPHKTINYEEATSFVKDNSLKPEWLDHQYFAAGDDEGISEFTHDIGCSECSFASWRVAMTLRRDGEQTIGKWIGFSRTIENMTRRRLIEDVPKCVENMLDRKPSLSACIHLGDLKPELMRALRQEEEQKHRSYNGNKYPANNRRRAEVTCHMPDCEFSAHMDESYGISIKAISTVDTDRPTNPSWLVALDPESYISDADELTRGLMWCRDPACALTKRGRALYNVFNQWDLPHELVPFDQNNDDLHIDGSLQGSNYWGEGSLACASS